MVAQCENRSAQPSSSSATPLSSTQLNASSAKWGSMHPHDKSKRVHAACWVRIVQDLQVDATPVNIYAVMRDLRHVLKCTVAEDPARILSALAPLLELGSQRCRTLTLLDAFATSVLTHPELHDVVQHDGALMAQVRALLEAAAADESSYEDVRLSGQLQTTQGKLGMYCVAYWEKLERCGLGDVDAL
jgi:hypothetical protein